MIPLSMCGLATYKLIHNRVAPGKPTDKSFNELVQMVWDHYEPKPSAIVHPDFKSRDIDTGFTADEATNGTNND